MPFEIPAAGWAAIASASTLLITGGVALIREKVVHKQALKKEVFLRKLQTYESNITYASEGIRTFRSICDNIRKASNSQSYNNLEQIQKDFENISKIVIPSLHTIQLYSKISSLTLGPLEKELKEEIDKLPNFKDDINTIGLEKAREKLYDRLGKIDDILRKVENAYQSLFKEMQKEIAEYL